MTTTSEKQCAKKGEHAAHDWPETSLPSSRVFSCPGREAPRAANVTHDIMERCPHGMPRYEGCFTCGPTWRP